MNLCFITLLALVGYARSHSWLACSDYAEKNAADWDPKKCRGFPRHASRYAPKNSFGQDTGFDHRPSLSGPACKSRYGGDAYSSAYPKAVYYPGQQVILAHPMKNHGADPKCTNAYIPDNGNKIYRGQANRDRDQTLAYYKKFLVADLGTSLTGANYQGILSNYPKPGFQNAPNFCKNTDRSLGTYSFNVPRNLKPGEYTFVWRWSFNSPIDLYSTCFDVIIAKNKAERDNMLRQRSNDLYVACGGKTSNNAAGSSLGCAQISRPIRPPGRPPRPPTRPPRPPTRPPRPPTRPPRPPTRPPRPPTRPPRPPTRPPRPPTRPPRPPTRPPRPPTRPPRNGRRVPVMIKQIAGEITLSPPAPGTTKRFVTVDFGCPIQASVWNARLFNVGKRDNPGEMIGSEYGLMQEQSQHISSGKIFFRGTYREACNVGKNPPVATTSRDE